MLGLGFAGLVAVTGGESGLQALGEQGNAPQGGDGRVDAFELHDDADAHAQETAGGGEHHESQRDLGDDGGEDAHPELVGAEVQYEVKPRVAQQQGAGDGQAHDQHLALAPGGPGGGGERGEQGAVESDPGTAPVVQVIVHGQGHREYADPGGQHHAAAHEHQQGQPPAPGELRVSQHVRLVDGGQHPGEMLPFFRAHPPQLGFIYHVTIKGLVDELFLGGSPARDSPGRRTLAG